VEFPRSRVTYRPSSSCGFEPRLPDKPPKTAEKNSANAKDEGSLPPSCLGPTRERPVESYDLTPVARGSSDPHDVHARHAQSNLPGLDPAFDHTASVDDAMSGELLADATDIEIQTRWA
jgi:hypothetical protein